MFIVVVGRGSESETVNFVDSHKDLESFCAQVLTDDPDSVVEVSPVKLARAQLQTRVAVNIAGLGSAGTGKGRPPGAMQRDPVTGQLLTKKVDAQGNPIPAKRMGRPAASQGAPSTAPATGEAASAPLVRNTRTGETLASAGETH